MASRLAGSASVKTFSTKPMAKNDACPVLGATCFRSGRSRCQNRANYANPSWTGCRLLSPLMPSRASCTSGAYRRMTSAVISQLTADLPCRCFTRMASANLLPPKTPRVLRIEKESRLRQQARVIWLYGLSGAGKSTIAVALERQLAAAGFTTMLGNGDGVCTGLNRSSYQSPVAFTLLRKSGKARGSPRPRMFTRSPEREGHPVAPA